jgi:hypothetical protein
MANFNWEYIMKSKLVLLAVLSVLSLSSFAGNDNANPCGNNGNNCNLGGNGGSGGNATSSAVGNGGDGGSGIGIAGASSESTSKSSSDATGVGVGIAGAAAGVVGSGNGTGKASIGEIKTTTTVQGDKVDAPHIPTSSSIAVSGNSTAECTIHKQKSFNGFFMSAAWGGHEVEPTCFAKSIGRVDVAIQIQCNASYDFKKAYNQVAKETMSVGCLD